MQRLTAPSTMSTTSSPNMTTLMKQECPSDTHYKCANGQCVRGKYKLYSCSWSDECKGIVLRRHYCPDTGWCEVSDWGCLRPCGFSQSRFDYNYKCQGYPGLCAVKRYYCPPVCNDESTYRCREVQKCTKGKNWCDSCWGYRCPTDGKCLTDSQKCNGYKDCSDGSDEVSCDTSNATSRFGDMDLDEWQLAGLVGGVFLLFLLCFCWCLKKSRSTEGADASAARAEATRLNQQPSLGGPRVTGTVPSAVIRPPAVTVRNAYAPHPSNTARSNPPSESGFYVPRASAPSNDVVSSAPRGYAAMSSTPQSYPNAANADAPPEENPAIGPPPSYEDAIQNDDRSQPKDPMLPTYEEVTEGTPGDKETFM